jgi:high-affinity iron transporter
MVTGWLVYAVPMAAVVLWPARRKKPAVQQPRPAQAAH